MIHEHSDFQRRVTAARTSSEVSQDEIFTRKDQEVEQRDRETKM